MDQAEFSALIEVSGGMVSKYENGENIPKLDTLILLEELTGIPIRDLRRKKIRPDQLPKEPLEEPIRRVSAELIVGEQEALYKKMNELKDINVLIRTVAENAEAIKRMISKSED